MPHFFFYLQQKKQETTPKKKKKKIDVKQNCTGARCVFFFFLHHNMYSSGDKFRSAVCSVILYSVKAALVFVRSGTGHTEGNEQNCRPRKLQTDRKTAAQVRK